MRILDTLNIFFVQKVSAQSLGSSLGDELKTLQDGSVSTESDLVGMIVKIAVPLGVISVVLLVVYAGYLLMSSQGDPDKLKEGRDIITNAIIGFVVVLLSVAILILISNTLGLDIYG